MTTLDKHRDALTFVIVKATEGITYTDPKFHTNWDFVRKKGFVRGAYHFYIAADAPSAQLKNYTTAVGEPIQGDLWPIVDVEGRSLDSTQSKQEFQKNLLDFLHLLEEHAGVAPIVYTGLNFANEHLQETAFSNYPLWIAEYTSETQPEIPRVWSEAGYAFWQRSSNYSINGVENDFDIFNGDEEGLRRFLVP